MDRKLLEIAAQVLKISPEEAEKHCKPLPQDNAYYLWNPARGGTAVIISEDGGKLGATSAVSFDRHLAAFRSGKRN